jgi:hypothetical protein
MVGSRYGASLANVLDGWLSREPRIYVNDAGRQMDILPVYMAALPRRTVKHSIFRRYQGAYVRTRRRNCKRAILSAIYARRARFKRTARASFSRLKHMSTRRRTGKHAEQTLDALIATAKEMLAPIMRVHQSP